MSTRIAVTGGRDFKDMDLVLEALDRVLAAYPDMVLVHGGASGADTAAAYWALVREVPTEVHPADWGTFGRAAGPIRNREMAQSGLTGCVAFPGGRGTANMVRECETAGVVVWHADQMENTWAV